MFGSILSIVSFMTLILFFVNCYNKCAKLCDSRACEPYALRCLKYLRACVSLLLTYLPFSTSLGGLSFFLRGFRACISLRALGALIFARVSCALIFLRALRALIYLRALRTFTFYGLYVR